MTAATPNRLWSSAWSERAVTVRSRSIRRQSGFIKLLSGQGISALGDWTATIAFMAITHSLTHSATAVGGILVLRLAPGAIAAPLAGRFAHRFGYRRTMLSMELVRAAMAAVVPLMLTLWWIYLWAFLIEVASLLFLPARDSSIPELVENDQIPLANSLVLGLSYGTIPLGAAVFAAAAALVSGGPVTQAVVAVVFFIDALTFLASFEFIRRIDQLQEGHMKSPPEADTGHTGGFMEAFSIPLVRAVMVPMFTIAFALGALFSLGIAFVRDVLDASNAQFGFLIALFGVGGGAGMVVLQARGDRRTIDDLRLSVAGIGMTVFAISMTPFLALAFAGAAGFGAAAAYSLAGGMSTLQERLKGEERVLAFTSFHVSVRALLGVGAVAAGGAADIVGDLRWPVVGAVEPARLVLFAAGLIVFASAFFVHDPDPHAAAIP